MRARVRIVSPDPSFAGAIGRRLEQWGLSVAIESDPARLSARAAQADRVDVLLVDVRRCDGALLGWLSSLTRALPSLQAILLNVPGQVAISIAAMRAGAVYELSAPVEVAALRAAIGSALRRRNKRLRTRSSLLERFERAMTAATFAEAGELDTAREILADERAPERPQARERDDEARRARSKREGT